MANRPALLPPSTTCRGALGAVKVAGVGCGWGCNQAISSTSTGIWWPARRMKRAEREEQEEQKERKGQWGVGRECGMARHGSKDASKLF